MNRKNLRRFIASVLSFILSLSCVTFNFESVFANLQSNVKDVIIRAMPPTGIASNINFSWTNPSWSSINDPSAESGDVIHAPEGFRVMERNITAGDSTYTNVSGDLTGNSALTTTTISRALTTGSLYSYRILPFHRHRYLQNDGSYVTSDAPYDSTAVEDVLFMTDLEVSASGSGNTLTVTWDNPMYAGKDIFSGYRIYYQRGGETVTSFNNYKDVNIENTELVRLNDDKRDGVSRLQFSIYDNSLSQGDVYAVKVEPLYSGSEIRKLTSLSYANINIGGTVYKIAFNSYTTNEYRTNNAYISIPLEILENGKDYLNLHWWGLSNTIGNIQRIEVYKGPAENDIGVKIGTIYSPQSIYVNYWQIDKPTETTYYQLKVFVEGMDVPLTSEIAVYDPSQVNITPNKPKIYVDVNKTATQNTLDVYWSVFLRYPYNENEQEFVESNGMYIDKNVKYDLWVSDSLENIQNANLPKILEGVTPAQLTQTEITESENPVYYSPVTTYVTEENGAFVSKPIVQNKVYYIKLVASKPVASGSDLVADPAYASKYFPAKNGISTPQALGKPPLKIKEDENGNELVTNNSIEVEWRTKWFEVYDSKTDSWYSKASVDNSEVHFGDEATTSGAVDFFGASSEEKVKDLFEKAGLSEDNLNLLPVREVDLTDPDIKYQMLYIPYQDITENEGGYEAYLEKIMTDENAAWTDISPTFSSDITASYNVTGLEKNTTYAIIIRPYRILEDGQKDAYPTYIMGTTLPDTPNVDITPTVPVLEEDTHDDMSITVKWQEHMNSLEYELAYSTNLLDDPASGTVIDMAEILENGDHITEDEIKRIYYKINALMPETGYYIWLRANSTNSETGAKVYSAWSSPIYVVTSELGKPDVPSGLGIVSKNTLGIYNNTNSTDLKQRSEDYLILEWYRNDDDIGDYPAAPAGGDLFEVLTDEHIKDTIVTKLNQLTANKSYYARVKARCTVSISTDGTREKSFTYILQFADNKDFKDALNVVVPEGEAEIKESTFTKESDWSRTVRFSTGKTDDEYDGDIIDSHYPLPDDDFEYIYDGFTNTLTYRFRSNKEDQDGLDDNHVDQRFISTLLKKKVYKFDVDLTYYNNYQIQNRVVEIPYSIMEALGEHKITLYFKADNVTYGFSPDFVRTNEINNLAGYGMGAYVRITSSSKPSDAPILGFGQTYISPAQKLSVDIVTPARTVNLKQFYKDVTVAIKLNDRFTAQETNVGAYYDTDLTTDWQRYDSVYNEAIGSFIGTTKIPATFSAIRKNAPSISSNDGNVINSVVGVNSRIAITDLQYVKPNAVVSTVQFNNLVAAVANGRKDVAINGALSDSDYNALSRKGIIINSATVSREEGVNALVKLYEVKTGRQASYTPLNLTSYTDIASANAAYQTSMLKAADLGFFETSNGARPKDTMSLAELLYMVDIIIRDSNI